MTIGKIEIGLFVMAVCASTCMYTMIQAYGNIYNLVTHGSKHIAFSLRCIPTGSFKKT